MDLGDLLFWLAAPMGALGFVFTLARTRLREPGWLAVYALNVAVTGGLRLLAPSLAGWIGAAVLVPTVLAPRFGMLIVGRLAMRQEYGRAAKIARLLTPLHPLDGWPAQPRILEALALAKAGDFAEAERVVSSVQDARGDVGRLALVELHRLRRDWAGMRAHLEASVPRRELLGSALLLPNYVRALAEAGELDAMLVAVGEARRLDPYTCLFATAFGGRPDLSERVLAGPLAPLAPELRAFWLGTAHAIAGDDDRARELLAPLTTAADPALATAAARRLALVGHAPARPTPGAAADGLERLAADVRGAARALWPTRPTFVAPAMVIACILHYLAEVPGDPLDAKNLYELGAVVLPAEPTATAWWRYVVAAFLHAGALHLVANMAGLAYFGPRLERVLGSLRFALVYVVSGVVSLIAPVLVRLARGGGEPTVLVGASGAIMGIAGALGGLYAATLSRERSRLVRAQLAPIALALGLQSAFDLATPIVAMSAHLVGALTGAVLGFALARFELPLPRPPVARARRALAIAGIGLATAGVVFGLRAIGRGREVSARVPAPAVQ
ncbi:MAG: rhomboid family intramembrane serine protease [Myxococcales bacterium]|nr:rhomboid family intramembrane serine protease [Myxococcales bacterium]